MTDSNKGLVTAALLLAALIIIATIVAILSYPKPLECPTCQKCPDEPVVITNTSYVEVEVTPDYKDMVVSALLEEVKADKDFRTCDGELYKASEVSVKKVYDGFTLSQNEDGDEEISDVQVKLNYDDGECYQTFDCGLNQEESELVCN